MPLNLETEDISNATIWLFQILKQYIEGESLSYGGSYEYDRNLRKRFCQFDLQGLMVSSRNADALECILFVVFSSFILQLSFEYC